MEHVLNSRMTVPYLYSYNNIITKVNDEFLDFTGFTMSELLGRSLLEIGEMLKVNSQILLSNIKNNYSGFIFTKSLYAREVTISIFHGKASNQIEYYFIEKPNSRLDDKLIFVEQTFIENTQGAAVYSVPDLILLKANKKYLDFMDSPFNKLENSIGRPITDIVKGFKGSQAENIWNTALETQKRSYVKEFKYDNLKRGITYWDYTVTPIYENGKIKYRFLTAAEITEKVLKNQSLERQNMIIKQQKEQLIQQKKELEAIIENIFDGIFVFNNKGQFILSNKSARELYIPYCRKLDKIGEVYKQSKFYDINGDEIISENIPPRRIMRGEKFKNMRMAIKFPQKTLQLDVSGTPIYDSEGKFTLGVFCNRDITENFKHQEAVRSGYELLNRVIDNFDLPVVRLSCPDLKIIDINKKSFSIVKLLKPDIKTIKQVKNHKLQDLFKRFKTSEYNKCINEVLKEKKTKHLNNKKLLVDDNEVYWNIIFEPVLEVNGELQEILIFIIDVTNEVKSNIIMERTLELQEEFLANISHELKTPLNIIFATDQLLNMYCNCGSLDDRKETIIKYIDSIKQNSYRLSKLINNIVDLSKIKAGFFELNLSNSNIVEVVEDTVISVNKFAEIKSLNIIFDTDSEEKIIAFDPEKIERVVLNLISNAIKFSDEGDEIYVAIKDKNEFVEISVKDNGIGIEDNQLNIIFDRFKQVDKLLTRNAEGIGIGLSLVKSIVELHGGRIYVESKFGKGSKFTVVLPSRKVMKDKRLTSIKLLNKSTIQEELSDVRS